MFGDLDLDIFEVGSEGSGCDMRLDVGVEDGVGFPLKYCFLFPICSVDEGKLKLYMLLSRF